MKRSQLLTLSIVALLVWPGAASPDSVTGEFVEVRTTATAPVATHTDGHGSTTAQRMILGWTVGQGSFHGEVLDGLAVVAVIEGGAAVHASEVQSRTRIYVDARATEKQQDALVRMVSALAPEAIQDVRCVEPRTIDLRIGMGCAAGYAVVDTGSLRIRTRRLLDSERQSQNVDPPGAADLVGVRYSYSAVVSQYEVSQYEDREDRSREGSSPFDPLLILAARVGGFSL